MKSPVYASLKRKRFDDVIPTMFDTLQPPRPEPVKDGFASMVYGLWCVLGASGVIASFWKHGFSGRIGFASYAAVFALALYSSIEERKRRSTPRDLGIRCLLLSMLGSGPMIAHMLLA